MKTAQRCRCRCIERCSIADRRMVTESLTREKMRSCGVADALLGPGSFAQLGEHGTALGVNLGLGYVGRCHHARQYLDAFL